MQTYIVRVYRARPEEGSVSGVIEDIESGQKQSPGVRIVVASSEWS